MKNTKPKVRLWSVLTGLTAILTVAAIVGNIIANQYATTLNVALNASTYKIIHGENTGDTEYFKKGFASDEEREAYEAELCATVEAEGAALLKNENNALPLASGAKVSLFGHGSVDLMYDDNGQTFTFGGNYTFGNGLKVLAFGQWFKDQELNRAGVMSSALSAHKLGTGPANGYGFVDGYGVSLGVNYPIGGGVAKAQVAYRDMENQDNTEFNRWTIAAAYDYPLSKRTAVYAMTGYTQESMEGTVDSKKVDADPSGYEFTVGMVHRF